MLKAKSKILLAIFAIIMLVSSYCFATVEPISEAPTTTGEDSSNTTEVPEDISSSWTNSDLYIFEDKVTISNVVDGNAFVMGSEVTISGEIGGDLFVIADKLNIDGGYIYSNLFALANEITVNGVVYDIYAACDTFNLEAEGFIYRDMKITSSNVNLKGKVRRDAYISSSNISFVEDAGTLIYGNLNYSSNSEIAIPEGIVTGEVKYTQEDAILEDTVGETILSYVIDLLQTLLLTFVVTLLLIWLTPKFVERVGKMSVAKSFVSLGIGFATPVALIIVSVLLLISSIGATIFLTGTFAFTILAIIGNTIASIFFGKLFTKVLKMEGNVKFVLFTLVSCLILWAVYLIPVVGGILSFIVTIFGIGTTLVNMVSRKEKKEETVEVKE